MLPSLLENLSVGLRYRCLVWEDDAHALATAEQAAQQSAGEHRGVGRYPTQAEIKSHLQESFYCHICRNECPEGDSATVDGCGHKMCRDCMKGFIINALAQRSFPIFCPICRVNNGGGSLDVGTHHPLECDQSCNESTR